MPLLLLFGVLVSSTSRKGHWWAEYFNCRQDVLLVHLCPLFSGCRRTDDQVVPVAALPRGSGAGKPRRRRQGPRLVSDVQRLVRAKVDRHRRQERRRQRQRRRRRRRRWHRWWGNGSCSTKEVFISDSTHKCVVWETCEANNWYSREHDILMLCEWTNTWPAPKRSHF